MAKAYINDGIIGNCRMLGCLTKDGELHRLFWPNIDHMQHIDRFEVGIKLGSGSLIFLTDPLFTKRQEYQKGTNILRTTYFNEYMGIRILQSDYCLMDKDVLLRRYEIENLSDSGREISWGLYSSSVTSISNYTGTLFDLDHEALIHYQRDQYMSITTGLEASGYQLGGGSLEALREGTLNSLDNVLMVHEGALSWNLGWLEAKGSKCLTMQLCFAHSYKELKLLITQIRKADADILYQDTQNYWRKYLADCGLIPSKNRIYDALYERTLLVFKLMYDEATGGLMAAPEVDENMEMCGRYAYCWGRDAAFIADALDQCGLHQEVEQFFRFAASTQEDNGSWFQRYCLDGNLAPAWGLQIDETGALLYGMWKHYQRTGNITFLQKVWDNVRLGADFLTGFMDEETGLPKPSRDLWEERWGEHTYSAASVYAGLISSVRIAESLGITEKMTAESFGITEGKIAESLGITEGMTAESLGITEKMTAESLGITGDIAGRWAAAAKNLKAAIEKELWDEERQCFLRGIRTQLYPESRMEGQECMMVLMNSKGAMRKVVCRDRVADISLLGLSVPFGVLSTQDPRMMATVRTLEEVLNSGKAGGMKRYEDDEYIGGNPWILTTLWLSLYYIENKEFEKALSYFNWAVKGRTELDLLPEQISKDTGKPIWIIPLTWSHAMYALVYHALQKEKLI